MVKLSKRVEYALIGMVHMSYKENGELTTAKELSETYNIPQELLGKVLQKLAKKKFILSVQGVKGGYCLIKPVDSINLSQVVRVIEGPIRVVKCLEHSKNRDCTQLKFCSIKNPMTILQKKLNLFFETITLKDIKQDLSDHKIPTLNSAEIK